MSIYGSSAGANVIFGKNDTGVAFGGPAPITETCTELENSEVRIGKLNGTERSAGGFLVLSGTDIVGKKLDNFSMWLKKTNGEEGTLTGALWSSSSALSGSPTHTFGTLANINTNLTTSFQKITFDTSAYGTEIAAGNLLGISWDNPASGNVWINMQGSNTGTGSNWEYDPPYSANPDVSPRYCFLETS